MTGGFHGATRCNPFVALEVFFGTISYLVGILSPFIWWLCRFFHISIYFWDASTIVETYVFQMAFSVSWFFPCSLLYLLFYSLPFLSPHSTFSFVPQNNIFYFPFLTTSTPLAVPFLLDRCLTSVVIWSVACLSKARKLTCKRKHAVSVF